MRGLEGRRIIQKAGTLMQGGKAERVVVVQTAEKKPPRRAYLRFSVYGGSL